MPKAQITLTPAESKRLIAKAVAKLPEVERALKNGMIIIGLGTTNSFVAEEILGRKIEKNRYVAGVVLPQGTSIVPPGERMPGIIIRDGKVIGAKMDEVLDSLTSDDVIIKGANAVDSHGTAGVFLASERGGTVGKVIGHVKSRGVNLIIPIGMEKFVPGSIGEISKEVGIHRFQYATGCKVGMMPISGKIVTEIEAIKVLTGAEAVVMGKGGVSGAEGSVTLSVDGTDVQLKNLKDIVEKIKGETFPRVVGK